MRSIARRPPWMLAFAAVLFVVLAAVAAGAMNALTQSRFDSAHSESAAAEKMLAERFGTSTPNIAVLVSAAPGHRVDEPAIAHIGRDLTALVRGTPGVRDGWSFWDTGSSPTLASTAGGKALILAWAPGDANQVRNTVLPALQARLTDADAAAAPVTVALAGQDQVFRAAGEQSRKDFLRAEMLIIPLIFILLWVLLHRALLAAITLATGIFAVVGALAALRVVAAFTDVSPFAANIALCMGIALGVDYGLFLIYRFREELQAGQAVADASHAAVRAAGHTIVFSAATVAASLAALLVFQFPFLSSFAYAGIAVVATAVAGIGLILAPALTLLGTRALPRRQREPDYAGGLWIRVTNAVMRRPLAGGLAGLAVLLLLGAPALGAQFGAPDDRVLRQTQPVRAVYDTIRSEFATEDADAIAVVAPDAAPGDISDYAARLSRLPGVLRVDSAAGTFEHGAQAGYSAVRAQYTAQNATGTWLAVLPTRVQLETGVNHLVGEVRSTPAPFKTLVGGSPAMSQDYINGVVDRLPLAAILIALVTFAVLYLMTGSVIAPLKATLLNMLSLSVMFGVLVWGFQEGRLADLLGFTPTGLIEPSIPILMFCIAYGLSMDYEVFLLARIKEQFDRTGDPDQSVVQGISRSAPLVTAAAVILAVSFAVYATSGVTFLQQLGIGMALTVLVDATLVRGVLVPAIMRLAGPWNWWEPRLFRRMRSFFPPRRGRVQ